jgi:heterodisulfide reductase subunit B
MKYGYYPGCSLNAAAQPYDLSSRAIAEVFGLELEEIADWNCCGATEYFSISKLPAYALVARNLALAASQDGLKQLTAPCSACYLNLRKTDHYMGKYPDLAQQTNEALSAGDLAYQPGSLKVRHLLEVVVEDVGFDAIAEKVSNPLSGLRVAPYYGCLIVRPGFDDDAFDDPEYPLQLDVLLDTLGAEVIDFPMKAHCCGGHMTQISEDTAFELIRQILHNADEYKADAIVAVCPMCQLNLDAYQPQVNRHYKTKYQIPVLYFTQLIGLAIGMEPHTVGIGREFVSARRALAKIGTFVEAESEPVRRRRRDNHSLPMPGIGGES